MNLVANTIKNLLIGAFVVMALVVTMPGLVSADAANDACNAIGGTVGSGGCNTDGDGNLNSTVATIVNIMSVVVGIIAVIMIIIGGFKYVASGGDAAGIKSAKDTILYAIVGLVIVAFAQIIVQFTLNTATGEPSGGSSSSSATPV